jgi:hypothetical protein
MKLETFFRIIVRIFFFFEKYEGASLFPKSLLCVQIKERVFKKVFPTQNGLKVYHHCSSILR